MTTRQPAEWSPHQAVWSAWPSAADLWLENLAPARSEVAALFKAIDDGGKGEPLNILVYGSESANSARDALAGLNVHFHQIPFGDIWLRDTAPIFVDGSAGLTAACFGFNGWGGKYQLEHDSDVSLAIALKTKLPLHRHAWILEGGSVDIDGKGLGLTTEQCLLNPNRNPGLGKHDIERALDDQLGIKRLIWLEDGLLSDHTDGHIDNLARFVAPGVVALPKATHPDDPNAAIFADAQARMKAESLEIVEVPSVGLLQNNDNEIVPASYMNFYVANTVVVVPIYDAPNDQAAVNAIAELFPTRRTIGLPARSILTGGGSFHCITQQVPKIER
jgi:agmatine deiminase